jgi:hypothetical protein
MRLSKLGKTKMPDVRMRSRHSPKPRRDNRLADRLRVKILRLSEFNFGDVD